jgi:hypothetical protein
LKEELTMLAIIDTKPANDRYTVESAWITSTGLPAVITMSVSRGKRCGYVAVPRTSPLYGVDYSEQLPQITKEMTESVTLGVKSPVLAITAGCGADDEHSLRRSLDVIIDVHGGLTYSGYGAGYPITLDEECWWFGYDCAHHGDDHTGGQPNWYCRDQCERLADQLAVF